MPMHDDIVPDLEVVAEGKLDVVKALEVHAHPLEEVGRENPPAAGSASVDSLWPSHSLAAFCMRGPSRTLSGRIGIEGWLLFFRLYVGRVGCGRFLRRGHQRDHRLGKVVAAQSGDGGEGNH